MRKIKNLNIGNTFRSANLNVRTKDTNDVNVDKSFKYKIDDIKNHSIPNDTYIIKYNRHTNDTINHALINNDYNVLYSTNTVIPFPVLLAIGNSNNSVPVYKLKKAYTDRERENVYQAFITASDRIRVVTDVDIIKDDPYDILFNISPLRYLIDRLELSFNKISVEDYDQLSESDKNKYVEFEDGYYPSMESMTVFYDLLCEALARWRIKEFLVVDTDNQRKRLDNILGGSN